MSVIVNDPNAIKDGMTYSCVWIISLCNAREIWSLVRTLSDSSYDCPTVLVSFHTYQQANTTSPMSLMEPPYQLNGLEIVWESLYKGRNPMLVTGVIAISIHELIYFGRFLPFLLADQIPQLRQYKLQPVSHNKCLCVLNTRSWRISHSIKEIQD